MYEDKLEHSLCLRIYKFTVIHNLKIHEVPNYIFACHDLQDVQKRCVKNLRLSVKYLQFFFFFFFSGTTVRCGLWPPIQPSSILDGP
jgi:hypothetical protein